ncbi:MAG: M28 family peptidase [Verrucomicrobia bacterium]|nr:M28 family peptidase [Verrucomicrobiota bacterium]
MNKMPHFSGVHATLALLGWLSALGPSPLRAAEDLRAALTSITAADLLRHTRVLSSDEFEGRAPGTPGEEKTVSYLVEQFKKLGLKPGHPDGGYIQKVPLVGFTAQEPSFVYRVAGQETRLAFPGESVIWSRRFVPEIRVADSEMIFVGYGVVAPEFGWDDYKGVDVRGKTLVMLVNDPAVPDPQDSTKLDETMFKGRAMTYYGRWTYKYEIATAKGAAAAIIVHETGPAGYPYFVVLASNSRENFDLQTPDKNLDRVAVEGWITLDKAKQLFSACGKDFDALKQAAVRKDFTPVLLAAKATFTIRNALREVASQNVIAKLEGTDPGLKHEYVVFTAHWDHLGRNDKLEGDTIFNGALDNATGTAGLLELAEACTRLRPRPKRTLLFLAVTAEEKGLLGAKHYATHPLYPLERTLANINMDGLNPWGRTRDLVLLGRGSSTLDDLTESLAAGQGRVLSPDSEPERGKFYRSDHFEFAKLGVPALYVKTGDDFVGKPPGYGKRKMDEFTERDYHKASDEIKPDWDWAGAVEDLQLLLQVGYAVAQADQYPEWKAGAEFKALRDEMLKRAAGK